MTCLTELLTSPFECLMLVPSPVFASLGGQDALPQLPQSQLMFSKTSWSKTCQWRNAKLVHTNGTSIRRRLCTTHDRALLVDLSPFYSLGSFATQTATADMYGWMGRTLQRSYKPAVGYPIDRFSSVEPALVKACPLTSVHDTQRANSSGTVSNIESVSRIWRVFGKDWEYGHGLNGPSQSYYELQKDWDCYRKELAVTYGQ